MKKLEAGPWKNLAEPRIFRQERRKYFGEKWKNNFQLIYHGSVPGVDFKHRFIRKIS
jgi:hypothetical protein